MGLLGLQDQNAMDLNQMARLGLTLIILIIILVIPKTHGQCLFLKDTKSKDVISYGKPILVVSSTCPPCQIAKKIINKLINEGYGITIEDISLHPDVKRVPTLKVGGKRITGLLSEKEYRKLLKDWNHYE